MKKNIHVVGAVIVEKNNILCAQRGADRILPYMWEFPGGKIENGEQPEEALVREIHEELNCQIQVIEKLEHTVYEYEFGIVHLTTFLCKLVEGTPQITEHAAIKWVNASELSALDWAPADIPTVKKLLEKTLIK